MPQEFFDKYARNYDDHFTFSLIGKAQREIVHKYIKSVSDKQYSVLEINCGTGEDAVFLSSEFNTTTCTDISGDMIKICNKKIHGLNNCNALVSSIQELKKNVSGKYELIFSNFGGINCLNKNELNYFADDTVNLLTDKGEIILVIMGRKCLWEKFYFLFKKQKAKAFRRSDISPAEICLKGSEFFTYYYSPFEIKNIFSNNFKVIKTQPVGFFIPPSYLNSFFEKHWLIFSALRNLENTVKRMSILSDFSDHYLIHLKKI